MDTDTETEEVETQNRDDPGRVFYHSKHGLCGARIKHEVPAIRTCMVLAFFVCGKFDRKWCLEKDNITRFKFVFKFGRSEAWWRGGVGGVW